MPLYDSEAVVLRRYALADSDYITIFLTKDYGKIRAVAQGVKRPNSRFAGNLEPLNHVFLEFYGREGRDLHRLRRADLIRAYLSKNPSLKQTCVFNYFAEIIDELAQEHQPNVHLFRLLLACLDTGVKMDPNSSLIRYFEIWCLKLSGLLPDYTYCSTCGKYVTNKGFFALPGTGHVRCAECAEGRGLKIGESAAVALQNMMRVPPATFAARTLKKEAAAELGSLTERLLEMTLEKQLKSGRLLKEFFAE